MPNHYDNDCPTAPVPCFYSAFGCPEKVSLLSVPSEWQTCRILSVAFGLIHQPKILSDMWLWVFVLRYLNSETMHVDTFRKFKKLSEQFAR